MKSYNRPEGRRIPGTVIALFAAMFTSHAFSHDDDKNGVSISSDHCNVDMQNDVRIEKHHITLTNDEGSQLRFNPDGNVWLDGKPVSVNAQQKIQVERLAEDVLEAAPEVVDMTLSGIEIAMDAVGAVAKGFDAKKLVKITDELEEQYATAQKQFASNKGDFYFDSKESEAYFENTFGDDFDNYIEETVESAVSEVMGNVFSQIGKALLGFDGGLSGFEERMETMGEEIEQQVEPKAEALEAKAESLCLKALNIDQQETDLQASLSVWKDFDLVTTQINDKPAQEEESDA